MKLFQKNMTHILHIVYCFVLAGLQLCVFFRWPLAAWPLSLCEEQDLRCALDQKLLCDPVVSPGFGSVFSVQFRAVSVSFLQQRTKTVEMKYVTCLYRFPPTFLGCANRGRLPLIEYPNDFWRRFASFRLSSLA